MPKGKPEHLKSRSSNYQRDVDKTSERLCILIFTEGKKTEPNYFYGFRATGLTLEVLGTGLSNDKLVERAVNHPGRDRYGQVWCVFDKDQYSYEQYERAVSHATRNEIRVAFSNICFELWFVLHIQDLTTNPANQQGYEPKLTEFLGRQYCKNDQNLYKEFLPHIQTAIERAKRLKNDQPWHGGPFTNVYELVEILLEQARPLG